MYSPNGFDLIWYGFLVMLCLVLMLVVMWITDRTIYYLNEKWNKIFPPLNPI